MPERSNKVSELKEAAGEYELPYLSKSRVMKWVSNPEHFRLKYLEGIDEEETYAMRRGTEIHTAIEEYNENVIDEYDRTSGVFADVLRYLPDDRGLWADWLEPYISNFLLFEQRRREHCGDPDNLMSAFPPVAVEKEHWRDDLFDVPMMGIADVVYDAASLPSFPGEEGVVIVDVKTGSVPDEKYRDDGIYLELEYYELLFDEDLYDVAGAAAYYPKEDELLVKPRKESYRLEVYQQARDLIRAVEDYEGDCQFDINPGPLCGWSPDEGDRSAYYGVCSQCSWNAPVENENTFREMVEQGYTVQEIANELNTTPDAVGYWQYKYDL